MNGHGKSNYPHIFLHLLTGLIALAALALALFNFRETGKISSRDRAVPVQVYPLPREGAKLAAPDKSKKKNRGDGGRSAAAARTKKKSAAAHARKKPSSENKPVPPARTRGLDEIITDIVNSATD